jgi:hypothetical protein
MNRNIAFVAAALFLGTAACSKGVDVDKVPVGTDVQVTRADGVLVEGKLAARDAKVVSVDSGARTREVPRDDIADVRVVDREKPVELPPAARFREITLPEDTKLALELDSSVSSETSGVEDPITAQVSEAVIVDGLVVIPAGSTVRGVVSGVTSAGKVKGRASLALNFDTINIAGDSHSIAARFQRTAAASKSDDAKKIGIPAAGGAIIGGILGGKKGAAIGAGVGGGAGAAYVLTTPGKPIELAKGTTLSLSLGRAIDVRVPIVKPL